MNYTSKELETATKEGEIVPAQLICEILPLLNEYMIGEFSGENDKLKMRFLNGNKFEMQIKAI